MSMQILTWISTFAEDHGVVLVPVKYPTVI